MPYRHNRNVIPTHARDGYEANKIAGEEYAERNISQPEVHNKEIEVGEVVNVIRSSDHPDFQSNSDIGRAKVRRTVSEFDREEDALSYAIPARADVRSYPLKHELVLVLTIHGQLYYFDTINFRNNPNQTAAPFFSINQSPTEEGTREDYQDARQGFTRQQSDSPEVNIGGDDFEVDKDIKPLEHAVGDRIYEGRFGQSIRLGRDEDQNPTIKVRVGQRDEVNESDFLETFEEKINEDPSSIYITEDSTVDLEPATIDSDQHLFSADESPDFEGAQILANSDRIVMNAKESQIQAFATEEINFVAGDDFTVDASGQIRLGTENDQEPAVRGQQLVDRLESLLRTLQNETHPTPAGPSGPPVQAPQYAQILQQILQTIRSEKTFVDNL